MALLKFNRRIIFIQLTVIMSLIASYEIFLKRYLNFNGDSVNRAFTATEIIRGTYINDNEIISARDIFNNNEIHIKLMQEKIQRLSQKVKRSRSVILNSKPIFKPNYNVHVFYYAWYGNKEFDGHYKHWNHNFSPYWKREQHKEYHTGSHEPVNHIGSNFYPSLGCYSSKDPTVINTHMKQIKEAGIGVIVISWSPPNYQDSPNDLLPMIFEKAYQNKVKVTLHIEPYTDRNPINMFQYLREFLQKYGNHPALYKIRRPSSEKELPMFYVYDSYLTPAKAWKEMLSPKGNLSIRGTDVDAVFIGLLVDIYHRVHILKSHFDGFYTYFTTNSFSYGSTWKNWDNMAKFSVINGLIYIPSIGPGYIDTQIRPWNSKNIRHRRHGQYYDVGWRTAISSKTNYISITSFNEWHEGTQIEPAISKSIPGYTYLDYEPDGSLFYLNLTKWWIEQFEKSQKKHN